MQVATSGEMKLFLYNHDPYQLITVRDSPVSYCQIVSAHVLIISNR